MLQQLIYPSCPRRHARRLPRLPAASHMNLKLPRGRLYLVDTSCHQEMTVLNYISAYAAYFIDWERPRCPLRMAMHLHIELS
jgi:hypothetical protein